MQTSCKGAVTSEKREFSWRF